MCKRRNRRVRHGTAALVVLALHPNEWTTGHDGEAALVPTFARLGGPAGASQTLADQGGGPLLPKLVPPPATTYDNAADARAAVVCADSDNPGNPQAWPPAARAADSEGPYFGSLWTYLSLPCADWPSRSHEDRYVGPLDRVTANPVLVVGN